MTIEGLFVLFIIICQCLDVTFTKQELGADCSAWQKKVSTYQVMTMI